MKVGRLCFLLPLLFISGLYTTNVFGADSGQWRKYTNAGMTAVRQDNNPEAEKEFLLAVKEAEKSGKPDVCLARSWNNLANCYSLEGKYSQAEQAFQLSLEITKKVYGESHPEEIAYVSQNLAGVYAKQHKDIAAEKLYRQSLEINERILGPDHPEVAKTLLNLAMFLDHRGRYVEAEPVYKRCLELKEKQLGPNDPVVIAINKNYANLLCKIKQQPEVEKTKAGKDVCSDSKKAIQQ